MPGWACIMASKRNGTLHTGVTGNLARRVHEHRTGLVPGFTRRHKVRLLVWYEEHATMPLAIQREKSLKKWRREWIMNLIEEHNPDWIDLYGTLVIV